MKKTMMVIGGVVLTALIVVSGVLAQQAKDNGSIEVRGHTETALAQMEKVSLDSAVKTALKAVPGKVLKAELENENGYLVYGIEIARADNQMVDVKIDAGNGKVLKLEPDKKDNEDREGEDFDNGHEERGER